MLFTDTSTNKESKEPAGKVGCGNPVCLAFGDVDSLGVAELTAELSLLGRSESRMAAHKAKLLAAISRLSSSGDAQQLVVGELLISKREAKKEIETANQLESLPKTFEALASGDITAGHAKLIARTSSEGKIVEQELLDKAKTEAFDDFVKTVREHQHQQADKAGEPVLERQRKKRYAQAFENPDTSSRSQHFARGVQQQNPKAVVRKKPTNRH